jgi:hypothetical protein
MERLTNEEVRVDESMDRYLGPRSVLEGMKPKLLDLVLNGPVLNSVSKAALRQIIRQLYSALAAYEDTGLMPNDVTDMMAANGNAICEIVKLKEELQGAKNTAEQHAAINETLFDSNMKLGADRKDLINELCQYCGKYKKAHDGACDGCRWREM